MLGRAVFFFRGASLQLFHHPQYLKEIIIAERLRLFPLVLRKLFPVVESVILQNLLFLAAFFAARIHTLIPAERNTHLHTG
jgi:hypothetical protein